MAAGVLLTETESNIFTPIQDRGLDGLASEEAYPRYEATSHAGIQQLFVEPHQMLNKLLRCVPF